MPLSDGYLSSPEGVELTSGTGNGSGLSDLLGIRPPLNDHGGRGPELD